MSSIFPKLNLHLCFSKIKCLPTSLSPPLDEEDEDDYHHHNNNNNNITSDNNHHYQIHNRQPMMVKKFNIIYNVSVSSSSTTTATTATTATAATTDDFSSDDDDDVDPPDFSTVMTSQRFFVSCPGSSNSILDSSPPDPERQVLGGAVPIQKYSPDPYMDFRRSMQEMIEAREILDGDARSEWEYLHELLLSYLTLNPKHTHKFIIGAFADLLVSILP